MRLAYVQGLLSHPSLNPIQAWALEYYLRMERRRYVEDRTRELEVLPTYLFPERGEPDVSPGASPGDRGLAFDGEPELPVTEEDLRWMSAGQVGGLLPLGGGRRV